MRGINLLVLILLLGSCLFTSCTRQISEARNITTPDYNNRINTTHPYRKSYLNAIGLGANIGSACVGAYAGTKIDFIKTNNLTDNSVSVQSVPNIMIGAAIGYGLSSLCNYLIAGQGKSKLMHSEMDLINWGKKYNKDFIPIGLHSLQHPRFIDRKSEHQYLLKSFNDTKDFKSAFPHSSIWNSIATRSIDVCSRSELLELYEMSKGSVVDKEIEKRYITSSNSVDEIFEASSRFTKTDLDIERLAQLLIRNISDVKMFNSKFPNSKYSDDIISKVYKLLSRSQLSELISIYSSSKGIYAAKRAFITLSTSTAECLSAAEKYSNIYSPSEVEKMAFNKAQRLKDYIDYINAYPNGNYISNVKDSINSYLKTEYDLCQSENDYLQFVNSYSNVPYNSTFIREANSARERIALVYQKEYYNLMQINNGYNLVKIQFKALPGVAVSSYLEAIKKDILSKKSIVVSLVYIATGLASNSIQLIKDIKSAGAQDNFGIIHATWWRSGIDGGEFDRLDEQFEDFPGIMRGILSKYNFELISCNYLGEYNDDRQDYQRDREFKADQCNKCIVEKLRPKDNSHYQIIMKNGSKYECVLEDGNWVIKGWIFDDKYNSLEALQVEFINQCRNEYCR